MQILVNCATRIYTRAEVLARGWAWHAGTAALALSFNCDAPPAIAHGGPLPPLPAHVGSISGASQPGAPDTESPLRFLPTPEEFALPVPNGAWEVTPGIVAQETTPVHPCQPGHEWNGSACVEGYVPPPPVSTPEPWSAALLGVGLLGFIACRRKVR